MENKFSKMMVAGLVLALSSICLMGCEPSKDAEGPVSITVKDADGNVYPAMKIGPQIWMAKNMNVETEGSFCYDNNPSNCEKYGRFYTWMAAQKVCPAGWHLPSKKEFETLLKEVGSDVGRYYSNSKLFNYLGDYAYLWSSTEDNESRAYTLDIFGNYAYVYNRSKSRGYSVRCLMDSN